LRFCALTTGFVDGIILTPMAQKQPMTDLLRRTIIESKVPLLTLEQATGVQRASISRFIKGKQSIRLDVADKLAAYFGLELRRQVKG
jgi:plasmid maintenance system antidote protein VapI